MLGAAPQTVHAQSDETAVERLVQILVKTGVLTKEQAESLAQQARDEARDARAAAPPRAAATGAAAAGAATAGAAAAGAAASAKPVPAGTVRVTYIPETVRKQIAAEVKQQVMQQATEEGWAEPNTIPGWTQRIRLYGDVRVRGEFDIFPKGNYDAFPDFGAINQTPNGYDATSGVLPPLLNTTQNRTRMYVRARLGVLANITDWADGNIELATGNDRSPVSTNQTLGQTGDFSKYAVWLSQAAITMRPLDSLTLYAGRFPNPYWTSNLLFYDDLRVDGLALNAHAKVSEEFSGFLIAGAYPVFNTDFAFGSTNIVKTPSHNAWMAAVQAGTDWKAADKPYSARFAIGYFGFENVEGQLSSPCVAPTSYGSCNTDNTRAPWTQFGNTVFAVRNITLTDGFSTPQPQYYGLASSFGVLDLHGQFLYSGFHPIDIRPEFDFVDNLNFNSQSIIHNNPVNNLGGNNLFVGSNTGYMVRLLVGHPTLVEAHDWNVALSYKYVGSDAVIDALTDPEFRLGGTNAKGFVLEGNYAFGHNIWVAGKWTSTNAVSGPPYAADTVLLDLNVKF